MANKKILVAHREFLEFARTKTFWISILAVPVMITIVYGAMFLIRGLKETKSYAVVDYSESSIARRIEQTARQGDLRAFRDAMKKTGDAIGDIDLPEDGVLTQSDATERVYQAFLDMPASDMEKMIAESEGFDSAKKFELARLSELELDHLEPAEQEKELAKLVEQDKLFAYFTIGPDPKSSLEGFDYVSNNFTDNDLRKWYGNAATKVVQSIRIADAEVSRSVANHIQKTVSFHQKKADASGGTSDVSVGEKANKYAPMAFVYLLWIAIMIATQMLLTNTVEEKSNRIIEVLLSSCSPGELMSGKIWGIAATGMTIVGSWIGFALLGIWLAPMFIEGFDFPLMQVIGDPRYLVSFAVYFLFGYLLYAAMLVAIGSVCNSIKEAQNLQQPVMLLLFVPIIAMFFIVEEPNGTVAKVLSYIPLFTPFTMMNRAGGPPEIYEYAITGIIMAISVWFAFKAAAKVFRIGVLMTGKPPKIREIFSWMRAS